MDVIGFLAPDGKIYNCTSWNHADLAERLCKKFGIGDYSGTPAIDELLHRGYVCLRARDAYMDYYQKDRTTCNFLTPEQVSYLKSILSDVSCVEKYDDIIGMLDYQKVLHEYFNPDGTEK